MKHALSTITGVDEDMLDGRPCQSASVARRMSWAAMRQTTRVEDLAYSLFGIFDINMPLLYGESDKAFIRLQEEILKERNDPIILAWGQDLQEHDTERYSRWIYLQPNRSRSDSNLLSGILAASPSQFAKSGDYISLKHSLTTLSITTRGLSTELRKRSRPWKSMGRSYSKTSMWQTGFALGCRHRLHTGTQITNDVYKVKDNIYLRFSSGLQGFYDTELTMSVTGVILPKSDTSIYSEHPFYRRLMFFITPMQSRFRLEEAQGGHLDLAANHAMCNSRDHVALLFKDTYTEARFVVSIAGRFVSLQLQLPEKSHQHGMASRLGIQSSDKLIIRLPNSGEDDFCIHAILKKDKTMGPVHYYLVLFGTDIEISATEPLQLWHTRCKTTPVTSE
jgi:hypothetical protein